MSTTSKICRICVKESRDFVNLSNLYYEDVEANLFIKDILHIKMEEESSTQLICNTCNHILRDFHQFYQMVKQAQEKYEQIIDHALKENDELSDHLIKKEITVDILKDEHSNDDSETINDEFVDDKIDEEIGYPFHIAFVDSEGIGDCNSPMKEIKLEEDCLDLNKKKVKRKKTSLRPKHDKISKEVNREGDLLSEDEDLDTSNANRSKRKSLRSGKKYTTPVSSVMSRKDSVKRVQKATAAVMSKYKVEDIFKDGKCVLSEDEKDQVFNLYIDVKCVECNRTFETYKDLDNHSRTQHGSHGIVKCCFMSLPSYQMIERHIVYKHILNTKMPRMPRSKIPCHVCNKLVRDCSMRLHLSSHLPHNKREFQCSYCHAGFGTEGAMKSHIALNHESVEMPCEECGKVFKNIYHLGQHKKRVHNPTGDVHTCPECGKRYKDYLYYTNHVKQHYGIVERVKCGVCDAVIKRSHLSSHLRAHDSKNHRQCPHCPYRGFSIWDHVKRVHEKVRTRGCHLCTRKFFTEIGLKDHISSCHTGKPEHLCEWCGATFKSLSNCHSHRKKMHPKEWEVQKMERAKIHAAQGDFPVCDSTTLLRNKHILQGEQAEQIIEDLQDRRRKTRRERLDKS